MALGSPQTKKALIGTFELRLGPLDKAGRLTAIHSVGIIDQVKLDLQMDSVDLLAGFPQKPVDTAITKFVTGFTATLREASRRNLNILLGNQYADYDTGGDVWEYVSTTAAYTEGDTAITCTQNVQSKFSIGDTVVIYEAADPGNVTIAKVSNCVGTVVTLATGQGLTKAISANSGSQTNTRFIMYKSSIVPGGAITGVPNYFAAQLIRLDRGTSRPVGFNFWKATLSAGMSLGATITEFASLEMQLKALEPAASEYAVGQKLAHLSTVIPTCPVFQLFDVFDSA